MDFCNFKKVDEEKKSPKSIRESSNGAVVNTLASHQCGLGLIRDSLCVICGLSLLLVLVLALRGFSPGYSGVPLSSKANTFKFQYDVESGPNDFMMIISTNVIPLHL